MSKDTTLTPLNIINSIGKFDLDPCGYRGHKTAEKLFVLPEDGLLKDWFGLVWLNPPYSNPKPFLKKMVKHNNGVALVLASVETDWFKNYIWDSATGVLFIKGRPKFLREDYTSVQLMRPVVLVSYGKNAFKLLSYSKVDGKFIRLR